MHTPTKRVKRSGLEKIFRLRIANLRLLEQGYTSRKVFAAVLGVSPGHLTHIIGETPTKAIGESAARDYEAKLGLFHGWLDIPH